MFNHFQKSFLIVLTLYILPPGYAMELLYNQQQYNYPLYKSFSAVVKTAQKNDFADLTEIKKYIEEKGADINWKFGTENKTLLILAIEHVNKRLVEYLLQKSATNICCQSGQTPLYITFTKMFDEKNTTIAQQIFEKLLEHGADIDCIENKKTLPMLAIKHQKYDLLEYLLQKGANINTSNQDGFTPLLYMLNKLKGQHPKKFNFKIFEYLLKHGANPNAKGSYAETPLYFAACGDSILISSLIEHGANVNQQCCGGIALMEATKQKNIQAIKKLCDAGSCLVDNAETVFHVASYYRLPEDGIKAIITHARFDHGNSKEQYLRTKNRFIETFLTLKQRRIPSDLIFLILSRLPENNNIGINFLPKTNFKNYYIFGQIENRIRHIKETLKIKGQENKTALQLLLGPLRP